MNDNEERPVTIITGRVAALKSRQLGRRARPSRRARRRHRRAARAHRALTREGYAEAELDQIGDMEGEPDEEPHLSAWQGALEGEVSIVMVKDER